MPTVNKDTKIGEVLSINMEASKYFLEMGMHCLGCPASQNESIEEACMVHGVDVNELIEKLNNFLEDK